jgi:hypothetical protein
MTWQQGYTLTQTVHTCRYVHHLNELNEPGTSLWNAGLRRIVLRAGIFGMLKSCDMVWRQLSVGNVHDVSGNKKVRSELNKRVD